MRPGQRFGLSAIEKREVWSRWKAGQSLHEIGRAFDKPHSCIRSVLLPRGGIAPAARRRSRQALTLAEREDISRGIASDSPLREIARRLDRAASTVSREICRHGGRPAYRAHDADDHAWDSALRPKRCLLALNRKLRDIVASKLILDWKCRLKRVLDARVFNWTQCEAAVRALRREQPNVPLISQDPFGKLVP
jgi:Helix-turn-helix domain